jgi:guanylate kinase
LRKRGDREEDIAKRLAIAETEMPFAKEYDHIFTVNDNLDQVAEEIKKIILLSIEWQQEQYQTHIEQPPKGSLMTDYFGVKKNIWSGSKNYKK